MNKKFFNVLLFTAGAAIGSLVTWKVVKTKYERIIQDEIDSFKESYTRCMRGTSEKDEIITEDTEDQDDEYDDEYEYSEAEIVDYHKLATRYNRSGDVTETGEEGVGDEEVPYINGPIVIMPEDFADGDYDHDVYCLTYFSDGVLANDWYEVLDIEETIGEESLKHFGDYTEDIVHVRNERLRADYEVARDPRRYADLIADNPLMSMHDN